MVWPWSSAGDPLRAEMVVKQQVQRQRESRARGRVTPWPGRVSLTGIGAESRRGCRPLPGSRTATESTLMYRGKSAPRLRPQDPVHDSLDFHHRARPTGASLMPFRATYDGPELRKKSLRAPLSSGTRFCGASGDRASFSRFAASAIACCLSSQPGCTRIGYARQPRLLL
jgi:hypothetical protein